MNIKKLFLVVLTSVTMAFYSNGQTLEGDGTSENPYLINSTSDYFTFRNLIQAAQLTVGDNGEKASTICAKLEADLSIDLTGKDPSGVEICKGLAYDKVYFCGTFDGNGHTITLSTKNIDKEETVVPEAIMMFENLGNSQCEVTATICNLHINFETKEGTETFGNWEGDLPSYFTPLAKNASKAVINNCFVELPALYTGVKTEDNTLSVSSAFVGNGSDITFSGDMVYCSQTDAEGVEFPHYFFVGGEASSININNYVTFYNTTKCAIGDYIDQPPTYYIYKNYQRCQGTQTFNAKNIANTLNGESYEGPWGCDASDCENKLPALVLTHSGYALYDHGSVVSNQPHSIGENGLCTLGNGCSSYPNVIPVVGSDNIPTVTINNTGEFISFCREMISMNQGTANNYIINFAKDINIDLTTEAVGFDGCWKYSISLQNCTVNGNGATITYASKQYAVGSQVLSIALPSGLFTRISGNSTVKDLNIVGKIGPSAVGILCNEITGSNDVILSNITVSGEGVPQDDTDTAPKYVGGFVGKVECSGNVYFNNCIMSADALSCNGSVGGFVGYLSKGMVYFENCEVETFINLHAPSGLPDDAYVAAGGFVGYADNGVYSPTITNCLFNGAIYHKDERKSPAENNVGSFIGYVVSPSLNASVVGGSEEEEITNMPHIKNSCAFYRDEKMRYGDIDYIPAVYINGEWNAANKPLLVGNWLNEYDTNSERVYTRYDPAGIEENDNDPFLTGRITFLLNGDKDAGLWKQSGHPSVVSGDDIYRHGGKYNSTPHEYENGICKHSQYCYEKPVEYNREYYVANAGNLRWLNDNWGKDNVYTAYDINYAKCEIEVLDKEAIENKQEPKVEITPVTIDLYPESLRETAAGNWLSNIELKSNVDGHGSTIKLSSISDLGNFEEGATYTVSGLFKSISGDGSGGTLTIKDFTLLGNVNNRDDYEVESVGLLANTISSNAPYIEVSNLKVGNYEGGEYNDIKGIRTRSLYTGGLFGSVENSEVLLENVVCDVDIKATGYVGGFIGRSSNTAKIQYAAYKGNITTDEDILPQSVNLGRESTAIGGLIGKGNSDKTYIYYSYLTGNLKNETISTVAMGAFVGKIDGETDGEGIVRSSFVFQGDINDWDSIEKESGNFYEVYQDYTGAESYLVLRPVGANDKRNFDLISRPDTEAEASEIITADDDYKIYYFYPSIDKLQGGKMKKMFASGAVYLGIVNGEEYPATQLSQNLGEEDKQDLQYMPCLTFELSDANNHRVVYTTCNSEIFSNEYRWDGEYYDHPYDEQFHVCKFCKKVDADYFDNNNEVIIETTDNLTDMTDNVSALTEAGLKPEITVTTDIVYEDVDYTELTVSELEELLPAKESIGTEEKPFNGKFDGEGGDFVNFAFQQNGLFNYVGSEGEVTDLNIVNGVILNDLTGADVVKNEAEDVTYAAALVNVNNGKIEYSSFVGAMATPAGAGDVVNCLVGQNNGTVAYSFAYFTDLETVKNSLNKAAIIVKGNTGVGRGAGKTTKVAANTEQKAEVEDDPYYKPADATLNSDERIFSNEEFASGVVAYWLNFEEEGYSGKYTCKYRQGTLTPELSENGEDAVHKIVYQSNKSTATVTGKAFANSKSTLTIDLSEAATSVKIGSEEATLTNDNTRATIEVPETEEADITVVVTFAGATGIETITPEAKANVMVVDGRLMVFGAEGQDVTVYNINGSLVYSSVVNSNRVDLPVIARGIYFVKVGTTTTKIVF